MSHSPSIPVALLFLGLSLLAIRFFATQRGPHASLVKSDAAVSWPNSPFRLIHTTRLSTRPQIPSSHYAIHNARVMALTHNTMFRGLNAVYNQAPSVQPGTKDAKDLLFYCKVIYDFIHDHHTMEEAIYFPGIEEATGNNGLMDENVAQHRLLHASLEKLRSYAVDTAVNEFDAAVLRGILEEMVDPLTTHLHEEVPDILDLWDKIGSETLRRVYQQMHDAAERQADLWSTGPFVLGCQDRTFLLDGENIPFPELPSKAVFYLVDWIISKRYASVWRFNPSTMYGEPRVTEFMRS